MKASFEDIPPSLRAGGEATQGWQVAILQGLYVWLLGCFASLEMMQHHFIDTLLGERA